MNSHFQKPGNSNTFFWHKVHRGCKSHRELQKPRGATETLSCSFLLLPSFEHQRSHGQAENKDQFSICPQRVACAHTREMAASPASATKSPAAGQNRSTSTSASHNSSTCFTVSWGLLLGNSGTGFQELSFT